MKNIAIGNTLLKDVEIRPNINRPEEFELWITTKKEKDLKWAKLECVQSNKTGDTYYSENNGLVDYCFVKRNDETGYRWSSRAGVVNKFVSEPQWCCEVVINYVATALTLWKIQEILDEYFPNQYEIRRDDKEHCEVRYFICKK